MIRQFGPTVVALSMFGGVLAGSRWVVWPYVQKWETGQYLIESLESSESAVRSDAAQRLGDRGSEAAWAIEPLCRLLEREPDGEVRATVAVALARIQGSEASAVIPYLIEALALPNAQLRKDAARALAGFGSQAMQSADSLAALLTDEDVEMRRVSADAIVRIGRADVAAAIQVLIDGLQSPNADDRLDCVHALAAAGPTAAAAIGPLTHLAEDPDERIRQAAFEALQRMQKH